MGYKETSARIGARQTSQSGTMVRVRPKYLRTRTASPTTQASMVAKKLSATAERLDKYAKKASAAKAEIDRLNREIDPVVLKAARLLNRRLS